LANVITTRATSDFSSNREKLDFAEEIALLDSNENPFTLMTMKFKKGTTGNIKHSWLYDELVPEVDTVDTSTACNSVGTTLYVDNVDRWAVGDIARREGTGETFLITAANQSTGALTIVRDYGATSGAYTPLATDFADEEYISWIGNAFEQGHALPVMKSTTEVQLDNYCQTQRTPFGLSEIAMAAAVRGEADWPFQMRKNGITHMRKVEKQNLWGHPMPGGGSLYATTNNEPTAAGGLFHFLTGGTGFDGTGSDRLVSNAELTKAEFLTWIQHCFRYGSANKVMYCAPLFRSALDSWGIADLQTFSEKTVYGMKVAEWVSAHGTIVFVTHKMLEDAGGSDGASAFMVDMDDVRWITYSNIGSTRLRTLDPYSSDGSTVKQAEYQTIGCLEVRTPKKHGCIYGTTSYAA